MVRVAEGGGQAGMFTDEQERVSRDSLVTPTLAITRLADAVPLQKKKKSKKRKKSPCPVMQEGGMAGV